MVTTVLLIKPSNAYNKTKHVSDCRPQNIECLFGAMTALNVSRDAQPPSIFQCQLKLYQQWFDTWDDRERNVLMRRLEAIDPAFVSRFETAVAATSGQ